MDAATETSTSRYAVEDRIGVLEELLSERFSCRSFLEEPVPRATIERILSSAQKTASWCNSQPWRLEIASGAAARKFREVMYKAASSGRPNAGDFPFPREYRGVYLERRRESGFQLYNSLGIPRGDKAAYARQALETTSSARRMSPSSTPTKRSASTARSIAAAMSRVSCWRHKRSALPPFRRRLWPFTPTS
jgi:nitroreductase